MDIKQLQQFVTLARNLNFRRSADQLGIAQPALSVSLRHLERELGVELFNRGRHGVALTEAGAAALPEAQQVLDRVQRLRQQARAGSEGEVGIVRLGFVGTAAYDLLPKALIALRSRNPGVQVDLHESTSQKLQAELFEDKVDIGIARFPMQVPDGLTLDQIDVDVIGVALPSGHPLTRETRVEMAALAGEPFIFPSSTQSSNLFHALMSRCLVAGFTPRVLQEVSHIQTIIGLVQGGVGIALLPEQIGKAFWKRIAFRPLTEKVNLPPTGLGLLYRPDTIRAAAARFREVMLELAEEPHTLDDNS